MWRPAKQGFYNKITTLNEAIQQVDLFQACLLDLRRKRGHHQSKVKLINWFSELSGCQSRLLWFQATSTDSDLKKKKPKQINEKVFQEDVGQYIYSK